MAGINALRAGRDDSTHLCYDLCGSAQLQRVIYSSCMSSPERRNIPSWAEQERGSDLAWIGENVHVFWPVAQQAYEEVGRGAIVVDTTVRPTGEGHPFGYFSQDMVQEHGNEDTIRMVAEYDPTWEMITVLLKTRDRTSTYRIGVLPPATEE